MRPCCGALWWDRAEEQETSAIFLLPRVLEGPRETTVSLDEAAAENEG